MLRRGTGAAAKHRQRPACSQRLIKVVQNNVASEVAVDSSLSGINLIHALFHGCRSKTKDLIINITLPKRQKLSGLNISGSSHV